VLRCAAGDRDDVLHLVGDRWDNVEDLRVFGTANALWVTGMQTFSDTKFHVLRKQAGSYTPMVELHDLIGMRPIGDDLLAVGKDGSALAVGDGCSVVRLAP
jgi:hypothetical protein